MGWYLSILGFLEGLKLYFKVEQKHFDASDSWSSSSKVSGTTVSQPVIM